MIKLRQNHAIIYLAFNIIDNSNRFKSSSHLHKLNKSHQYVQQWTFAGCSNTCN